MCSKNFENRLTNKTIMSENVFDRDFSIVKNHGIPRKILKVRVFYPKCLNSTSNLTKHFPEIKTFESSQHFWWNTKFVIMDYLPGPCKIPIQKFLGFFLHIFFFFYIFLSDFQNIYCTFYDNLWLNIGMKTFYLII